MKAVVYQEPFKVAVESVPDPSIETPTDVVVQVTSSAICGSDLHMYEGRTAAKPGIVFGHENLGIVVEVGDAVATIIKGDRVVMPFNVACGFCKNCLAGYTGFCLTVNPGLRRRRLWLRRDGALQRWTGRVCTRSICRLQLFETTRRYRA